MCVCVSVSVHVLPLDLHNCKVILLSEHICSNTNIVKDKK